MVYRTWHQLTAAERAEICSASDRCFTAAGSHLAAREAEDWELAMFWAEEQGDARADLSRLVQRLGVSMDEVDAHV